jgi:colanic acid/amylovoran biosynthesis glycosyltransferase
MTLKLGYMVPEFPSQTHAFFWREAAAIRSLGTEPVLFSTRQPPDDACPHAFGHDARAVTHYTFPPRLGSVARTIAGNPVGLIRAVGYVAGLSETSIFHRLRCLALILPAADLAAACKCRGIKHVHIHSFANSAHVGALSRLLGGPTYSLTLHGDAKVYGTDHAAKAAGAVLLTAVTQPLADDLARRFPQAHIATISMGVDTDMFCPRRAAPEPDGPNRPLIAATVARLHPLKGHVLFLEAMARLRNEGIRLTYQIAGSGPAENDIRRRAADLGLDADVEFLGSIGEAAVVQLFQRADIAPLPSVMPGEAAPVMVMEAMACGVTARLWPPAWDDAIGLACVVTDVVTDVICDGGYHARRGGARG